MSGWQSRLVIGAAFVWVAAANLAPIIGNDVHAQIRVGADVLRAGQVPRVESYSATASGRPFTAHEWLASVIFYGLDRLGGPRALCLLQVVVALSCAALLWRSLTGRIRKLGLIVPLLLLCCYLLAWRAAVRPHLFSMLALSATVFALERWRRSGRWRDLIWLVPMQLLWINLHGEAPLGPAILLVMALGAAVCALAYKRWPRNLERPYRPGDVVALGTIGGATAAACLANPYGWRIFTFAGNVMGDAYIHRLVYEWRPPFAGSGLATVHVWICCAYVATLAILWLGLLGRAIVGPRALDVLLLDLVLAAFATVLSLQAIRFVAYAALLGFPVMARSVESLEARMSNSLPRRRPLLELAAVGALIYSMVFGPGLIMGRDEVRDRRPFGWGYGENMPFAEIDFIRDKELAGTIYDEYPDGALIIRELAPRVRPVMDSRIDVYGEALTLEYFRSSTSVDRFREYLRRYDATLVLRSFDEENRRIYDSLAADPDWVLLLKTRHRFLFARRSSQ